jgi:hypothetical protein
MAEGTSSQPSVVEVLLALQASVSDLRAEVHDLRARVGSGENSVPAISEEMGEPRAPSPSLQRSTSRPSARDPPISSFSLADAAATWTEGSREVKLRELPRLGRGKGELPYGTWKWHVLAALDAARIASVLQADFPEGESDGIQEYYRAANAVLFHALLSAVKDIPVLGDGVVRLFGKPSSAREAWLAIKGHFVRLSANNRTFMLKRLQELDPREGESMEAFLGRCAKLQMDFAEYDLVLEDKLLITQVLSRLSIQWKTRAGLDGPLESLSWADVSSALQTEDNARRQSNTKSPEALLPLGWTRRTTGDALAADGRQKTQGSSSSTGAESGSGAALKTSGSPKQYPPRDRSQSPSKVRVPIVCWHCQQMGHLWGDCTSLPSGWKPGPQDKAKAEAAREEMRRRKLQSQKDKAAHAARSSEKSSPSSEGKCSQTL